MRSVLLSLSRDVRSSGAPAVVLRDEESSAWAGTTERGCVADGGRDRRRRGTRTSGRRRAKAIVNNQHVPFVVRDVREVRDSGTRRGGKQISPRSELAMSDVT